MSEETDCVSFGASVGFDPEPSISASRATLNFSILTGLEITIENVTLCLEGFLNLSLVY